MSNDGLADSASHIEQPGILTAGANDEGQRQQQEESTESSHEQLGPAEAAGDGAAGGANTDAVLEPDQPSDHAANDGDAVAASSAEPQESSTDSTAAADATPSSTSQEQPPTLPPLDPSDPPHAATTTADVDQPPGDNSASADNATTADTSTSAPSNVTPSSSTSTPAASVIASAELEKAPSEGSTSNAGSSTTLATSSTKTAAPKKFTSSLSMNKKFLGKSGATDAKSPQLANASAPKAGISPVARSPALASPGIPAHPGTSASPPINSSSAPRLLTGKLSSLAAGSVSGSATTPSSATTWGRPGLMTGAPSGAAFGKSGFVPAGQVAGPPGSVGPRLAGPPLQQSLGRMRGAFGQQSRAGQAPWAGANRGAAGFSRGGGSLDQDFPSFQEAAKAEEQRQHALLAKERAEKMAAVAQAAYNQRVLDGLKSFSGEYTSSTTHWDELDDDDDDLGDVLEFADGMRYEVPQSATLPTEAEAAAFQQAAKAESEAAALQAGYRESLAKEQGSKETSSSAVSSHANKSERFIDDFSRSARSRAQEEQQTAPAASRQPVSGRTLFNDRLGRFEPYAGRASPSSRKDSRDAKPVPPSLLQRPSRGPESSQEQARPAPQRAPSEQQASIIGKANKSPLSPPSTLVQPQAEASQLKKSEASRKVESPWAKLPPVVQQPIPTDSSAGSKQASQPMPTALKPPAEAISAPPVEQPSTPAVPASSIAPAEDPEEAYKREMRSIAEQARKRRQEEELEREAQKDRARKKAQELEEKMKASQKDTPAPMPTSAKPMPTTILSPPASKSDRQSNWRKPSTDSKATQESPKQIVSPQDQKQINGKNASVARQTPAERKGTMSAEAAERKGRTSAEATERKDTTSAEAAERKGTTSAEASEALADNAKNVTRSSSKPEVSPDPLQTEHTPAVRKRDALNTDDSATKISILPSGQHEKPIATAETDEAASPSALPRVRLGRRTSPRDGVETKPHGLPPHASGVPHAFPQPTILVGRNARPQDGSAGSQPVSALDKIMSQVRAAQDDLKTRQTAAAMLEEERRRLQSSSKEDFDGALDRISQALSRATIKSKARESAPASIKMNPPVVVETFEQTIPERPQSPRIWKTFNVKIPSVLRLEVRDLPAFRIRAFEDPLYPPPIYSSSWIPPKGMRLPRNMTLEEFLFGEENTSAPPRVKVSKLFLISEEPQEEAPVTGASGNFGLVPDVGGRTSLQASSSDLGEASLDSAAFIRLAPTDEEEDVATVPFEELEDNDVMPAVIKVSLPKTVSSLSSLGSFAAGGAPTQEAGRFKTYGPKLPENSTVAFRRGISPSKPMDVTQLPDRNIFMVNSELNGSKGEALPNFMRSYDQQVVDEVSAPSKAFAAVSTVSRHDIKASSPMEPVFPSLSPGVERNVDSSDNAAQAGLNGMRREELPRHVIAELERLNATVSAAPLTNPARLDSPASLLAGRSTSPWAMGSKATMMPSALSLSAIDPSMSVWSKPTEETAAAAAAAFNSASKDTANDSVQENSLKDLVDDYPSSMPSNAMDLPISDGERPQSKDSESQRRSPARSRSHDRHHHAMSISQVMSSTSPNPPSMPLAGRQREHGSSRHESFSFSPAQGYPVESSPYAMSAQLPYSAGVTGMHPQAVYSPALVHPQSQYGGYVSSAPSYGTGYSSANGMLMSPAYAATSPYSAMPVAVGQDYGARSVSTHMGGQSGGVWVSSPGMMNGSFTPGTAMSPYGSGAVSSGGQSYGGHSSAKSRMHSSPMYGSQQQQRMSPIGGGESHQQHVYGSYGYPGSGPSSAVSQHSPRHTFSSQSTSPAAQGPYGGQHANGSSNHLRSGSAQQYGGRRQGW